MNPYIDEHSEEYFIRTFQSDTDDEELIWHRDRNDRTVEIVSGEGWQFQFDNELPFNLNVGDTFNIKKMMYHRLIKSELCDNLVLRIYENV
jgi:hypothetical protein